MKAKHAPDARGVAPAISWREINDLSGVSELSAVGGWQPNVRRSAN